MGILSDLNRAYKSGDGAQFKRFLCENSGAVCCGKHMDMPWDTDFEISVRQPRADRRMKAHEFEIACSREI